MRDHINFQLHAQLQYPPRAAVSTILRSGQCFIPAKAIRQEGTARAPEMRSSRTSDVHTFPCAQGRALSPRGLLIDWPCRPASEVTRRLCDEPGAADAGPAINQRPV